jgi:hypothetical protein
LVLKLSDRDFWMLRDLVEPLMHAGANEAGIVPSAAELIAGCLATKGLHATSMVLEAVQRHAFKARHTSLHPLTNQLVGLHLDSWCRLPDARRKEAALRACVNLGRAARCLDVVPTPSEDALAWLGQHGRLSPEEAALPLAARFLRHRPDLPVLRLMHLPGELYVAPTENLIHDGVRIAPEEPDLTLAFRLHLQPA